MNKSFIKYDKEASKYDKDAFSSFNTAIESS
jgi:hypothetical protein